MDHLELWASTTISLTDRQHVQILSCMKLNSLISTFDGGWPIPGTTPLLQCDFTTWNLDEFACKMMLFGRAKACKVAVGCTTKLSQLFYRLEWAVLNKYPALQQSVLPPPCFVAKAWLSAITFFSSGLYRVPSGKMTRYICGEKNTWNGGFSAALTGLVKERM